MNPQRSRGRIVAQFTLTGLRAVLRVAAIAIFFLKKLVHKFRKMSIIRILEGTFQYHK